MTSTKISFAQELGKKLTVVELEQRLEMLQAWGYYCCEYGDHGVRQPDGSIAHSCCGSL
jgi:hypothetical protein